MSPPALLHRLIPTVEHTPGLGRPLIATRYLALPQSHNHDPARCWMAMFAAYYDASGAQTSGTPMAVAGLVSKARLWLRFEKEWEVFLMRYRVPYLHMKEFAHSKGPFDAWKGDEARRAAFLNEAARIIKRGIHKAFVCHVFPADLAELNEEYELGALTANVYAWAAFACLWAARGWLAQKHPGCPLEHIIESGDAGQSTFVETMRGMGVFPAVKPKQDPETARWVYPFQAADFVAYEHQTAARRYVPGGQPARPGRQSFGVLLRLLPYQHVWWDARTLAELCRARPDVFPRKAFGE